MSIALAILGAAGVPENFATWLSWLDYVKNYVNHEAVRWGFVFAATLILFSIHALPVLRPHLRLELSPSYGPALNLVLAVTNRGKTGQFFAKCTPVALRNSPNELSIRTVALQWENCNNHEITIPKYSTENLIIAKFWTDYKTMLGEMSLWGLTAKGPGQFEWSRWNISPEEKLPEYDLEIRIFGEMVSKPHVAKFTLRPRKYSGPLEMFRTRKR